MIRNRANALWWEGNPAARNVVRTLLAAAAILLVGTFLLFGVQALLPDHTEEYRTRTVQKPDLFLKPEGTEELTLYPWQELTHTAEGVWAEGLYPLVEELLQSMSLPYELQEMGTATVVCNASRSIFGFRDVELWLYDSGITDFTRIEIAEQERAVKQYVCSAAFTFIPAVDEWQICYFCLREVNETSVDRDRLLKGYAILEDYARNPDANESLFGRYFASSGYWLPSYDGDGCTVWELLYKQEFESLLYGDTVYIRYTNKQYGLTFLCDPVTETVIGFSLEPF